MSGFDSGIKGYVVGKTEIVVYFPVDWRGEAHISCYQCNYFSRSTGRCHLTQEISEFPEKFVGGKCPLKTEEDGKNV